MSENFLEQFERMFSERGFADALPIIEDIVRAAPGISTSWLNLGATLAELGRHVDAAASFWEASRLDPTRKGLFTACYTLVQAGEDEELLELMGEELETDPTMLRRFTETAELSSVFQKPAFQELARRFRSQ